MSKILRMIAVCAIVVLASCTAASALDSAADFSVIDEEGKRVSLSDFKGTPVIVNFWATWCPPCRAELPAFDKLAAEYEGKIQFMMVDLTDGRRETVEGAKQFAADEGYSFPLFFDTQYEGASAYAVRAIPTTVVINANAEVEEVHIGGLDEATLRRYAETIAGR